MKDDFLTIPDAPDYEINSKLIVRRKTDGFCPKICAPSKGFTKPFVYIRDSNNKQICRTTKYLRAQAKAAISNNQFFPIPSFNYKYEINRRGQIRHVKRKVLLKTKFIKAYGGQSAYVASILAEVFGNYSKYMRKNVSITKNYHTLHFQSFSAAAKFLAPVCSICYTTLLKRFSKRVKLIGGWKITYPDVY